MFVAVVPDLVGDLAARVGRLGQLGGDVQPGRAQESRIEPVVHVWRSQRDGAATVALGRGERGEVTRQHLGRGYAGDVRRRPLARRGALVRAEKEQLVSHNRPTQRAAELVALEPVVRPLAVRADRRKRVGRVELVVPRELEGVPREAVRARLRHGVDRRPRFDSVLCGQTAGRDTELLQRVRERQRVVDVLLLVVVVCAVQNVRDAGFESAPHRDPHAARRAPRGVDSRLHRRAREHEQVGHLAALERQLEDTLVLDHGADAGAAHVHERRRGVHGDRLLERPQFERCIDRRRRAYREDEPRLHVAAEAL